MTNKTKILNSVFVFAFVAIFMGCGSAYEKEIEAQESASPVEAEPVLPQEEKFCFNYKDENTSFPLEITIKGESVTGTSDETIDWTGEKTTLSGTRKGDTLYLKSTFRDGEGGEMVTVENIWHLQADKLLQFETAVKNEVPKLTNPANPTVLLTFTKTNCN